jgi:Fe2+ transport system protein FeoA
MNQVINFKHQSSHKSKRFQEFVFVSDSAIKLAPVLSDQLQLDLNSRFLDRTEIGDLITIKQIHAPQNIVRQLQNFKLKPNRKVQLVSRTDTGSVVVKLNNSLLGISKEIAQRIVVTLMGELK